MHPSLRSVLSAARTCKRVVWSCMSSVRKIPLLCSCLKRNKRKTRGDDETIAVTSSETHVDETQEAVDNQPNTSTSIVTVALIHGGVTPHLADGASALSCEEKTKKITKSRRRNKRKVSGVDTLLPAAEMSNETMDVKETDEISRVPETPADSSSLTPPTFEQSCTPKNEVVPCKSQEAKKEKKARRKKGKARADALPISQELSEKTVPDVAKGIKETPTDSSTIAPSSDLKNEEKPCKKLVTVVAERPGDSTEVPIKKTDEISRVPETPAESTSPTPPTVASSSTTNSEVPSCKSQEEKKEKKARRKKGKAIADSLSLAQEQSGKTVPGANKSRLIKEIPTDSSTNAPSPSLKNKEKTCIKRVSVVEERQGDAMEISAHYRRMDENSQGKRANHSDDVPCTKEQRSESNSDHKEKPAEALNMSGNTAISKSSGDCRPSTLDQSAIAKRNTDEENTAVARTNVKDVAQPSNNEVKLDKVAKPWVLKISTKKPAVTTTPYSLAAAIRQPGTNGEVYKDVNSILNKIAKGNLKKLTANFKALPIDTIERLENVTAIVLERAIREQSFAPIYASLCSAVQSVRVTCAESEKTVTFKALIRKKCQAIFDEDKIRRTKVVEELAKINSCTNPEKKKELLRKHEENETRLRIRSVGNCRFIGELFKKGMVTPDTVLNCVTTLVGERSEEPLESLCKLLRIVGKELERVCNLNETFEKLKALSRDKEVITRIQFMIRDLIDLRKKGW